MVAAVIRVKGGSDDASEHLAVQVRHTLREGYCSRLVVVTGVLGGTRLIYPQGYPDPFLPYTALMAEQAVLHRVLCDAQWHDPSTHQAICKIVPVSGPFDEINVYFCDCDLARLEVAFWSEQLRVADLILHWERPDTIIQDGMRYELVWDHPQVRAYTGSENRYTLQTLVPLVTWCS